MHISYRFVQDNGLYRRYWYRTSPARPGDVGSRLDFTSGEPTSSKFDSCWFRSQRLSQWYQPTWLNQDELFLWSYGVVCENMCILFGLTPQRRRWHDFLCLIFCEKEGRVEERIGTGQHPHYRSVRIQLLCCVVISISAKALRASSWALLLLKLSPTIN